MEKILNMIDERILELTRNQAEDTVARMQELVWLKEKVVRECHLVKE